MTKIESGRSMVEMLGVLAIIGVLSIGGIAGYTMAMNRHRANTAIDYATKVAMTAQTVVDPGITGSVSGETLGIPAPTGYAATVQRNADNNQIYEVTFTQGVTADSAVANAINTITGGKTEGSATIKFGESGIIS